MKMVFSDEIETIAKNIHAAYYSEDIENVPMSFIRLHRALEELFNYAGIESTLAENNPDKPTVSDLIKENSHK